MNPPVIRPLEQKHRDAWLRLWRGYQAHYEADLPAETTTLTWQRFHDPAVPVHVLGAFDGPGDDSSLIGIVHYLFHYSCWTTGPYCYLQDLYVDAPCRGSGAGRALIEAVCDAARANGSDRVYWLTQQTNTRAMALYDQVAVKTGFLQYRRML